ncbi:MAG: response regulator [Deltaproteobacteria bacterium]|nr:response regulator [Deltaproteobacteria bacterium]
MSNKRKRHSTDLMDRMVFIGCGLAAIYWILESLMTTLQNEGTSFIYNFIGYSADEFFARLLVLCFFLIFGSHAQYTINQRRKLDEALVKSEEKYRTIIENIEDGYYEADLEGFFSFVNDSMSRITGYSKEKLRTAGFRLFTDDNNFIKLNGTFKNILQNAIDTALIDLTFIKPGGTEYFVEASVHLKKDSRGRAKEFRGLIRDVTRRRQTEALKQEKAAAEAASRAKSEFLANMSHEIRTPLNSIIGLIELMSDSNLDAEQKEDLDVVLSAAYALLSIINDILDFSKIEAGRLELENIAVNLRNMIGDSLKIIAKNAHEKGLELAYRVAPDVPDYILGDSARLRQVLLNLAGNAVKFTEKGEVIVSVEAAMFTETKVDLVFSVIDTGIGIAEDKLDKVFSPFEQADSGTSRRFGGTGLGLAVSAQLVELMGGTIRLESAPGKGSSFYFSVSFDLSTDEKPAFQSNDLSGVSALVVDDNASSCNIIKEMLESWNISAKSSLLTGEAKKILIDAANHGEPFDIVIIDFDLANSEKNYLPEWIKKDDMVSANIIMMLTSSCHRNCKDLVDFYAKSRVNKPVRPSDLLDAVMIALDLKKIEFGTEKKAFYPDPQVSHDLLHFLVAEDTPFNQKFINRLLDRWGFNAEIVENGYEVLEALKKKSYDLLLMDIQMPEMDGLEAARAVRKIEKEKGGHIPIIAMTAHTMKGDRELCINAGMDDYVSKPISSEILYQAIKALLPGRLSETNQSYKKAEKDVIFDKERLLEIFDNDWNFFKESVDMFQADYPGMIVAVKNAVKESNSNALRRSAHALKGILGNFQAESAVEAAYHLEEMGTNGDFCEAENKFRQLEYVVDKFSKELSGFVEDIKV